MWCWMKCGGNAPINAMVNECYVEHFLIHFIIACLRQYFLTFVFSQFRFLFPKQYCPFKLVFINGVQSLNVVCLFPSLSRFNRRPKCEMSSEINPSKEEQFETHRQNGRNFNRKIWRLRIIEFCKYIKWRQTRWRQRTKIATAPSLRQFQIRCIDRCQVTLIECSSLDCWFNAVSLGALECGRNRINYGIRSRH